MWKDCCDYPHFIAKVCNIFEVSYDSVGALQLHHPQWKLYKLGLKWAKTSHIFRYQGHLWKCQDPLEGKKKKTRPFWVFSGQNQCFLWRVESIRIQGFTPALEWYPHHMFSISVLFQNLVAFGDFLQEPLPQSWGKTPWGFYSPWSHRKLVVFHNEAFRLGPPPWLRKPVPSPEISRSFAKKKQNHSGDHLGDTSNFQTHQ